MAGETSDRKEPARQPRCPICGKPREERFRPFCSRRCRDRDFINWADGRYAVPAVETEEDEPGPGADD